MRKQEDAARVVESTFKHFGRIDILVNAAAGNFLVSAEDLSPNGFRTGKLKHLQHFTLKIEKYYTSMLIDVLLLGHNNNTVFISLLKEKGISFINVARKINVLL